MCRILHYLAHGAYSLKIDLYVFCCLRKQFCNCKTTNGLDDFLVRSTKVGHCGAILPPYSTTCAFSIANVFMQEHISKTKSLLTLLIKSYLYLF